MKKLSILLLAALLIFSIVICDIACSSDSSKDSTGIAGIYINQDNASEYIELREDGTFYAEGGGMEFNGEWEVEGTEIRLYWDDSVTTGTIESDKIIESDSTVWIKQQNGSGPAKYKSIDIGIDGGALDLAATDGTKCSLTIQSGALTETTNIKITSLQSSKGSSLGSFTNDFLLEPEGLVFAEPVTVAITVPNPLPDDRVPVILHTAADGSRLLLETQMDGQTLTASLAHFSYLSPVAPTAAQLELYWDSIELEIDTYGLNVERVRSLASVYVYAETNSNIYSSIDISSWEQELWAHTNDLIIMGSLECSNGNHQDAQYLLEAARNIAILCYFSDLEADVDQVFQNCQQLPGSSFPEIYFRISEPSGFAEVFINDVVAMRAFADPLGVYDDQQKQLIEGNFNLQIGQNGLAVPFKFLVRPREAKPWEIPSGHFEVEVDGQIVFSKQLTAASSNDTLEEILTLTFPNVSPP